MIELQGLEALVLVGGKGTRLKDGLGANQEHKSWPKALVRIQGEGSETMLDWTLAELIGRAGIDNFVFLTSDDQKAGGDLIESHLKAFYGQDASKIKSSIQFSREVVELGTAGAIVEGLSKVTNGSVLVTPIDTIFPFERIKEVPVDHAGRKSIIWMVTSYKEAAQQNTGKILCNQMSGQIMYVLEGENPIIVSEDQKAGLDSLTSGGVLIVNKEYYLKKYQEYLDSHIEKKGRPVSVYGEFIRWLVENGEAIYAYDVKGPVMDLGRPESLALHNRKSSPS